MKTIYHRLGGRGVIPDEVFRRSLVGDKEGTHPRKAPLFIVLILLVLTNIVQAQDRKFDWFYFSQEITFVGMVTADHLITTSILNKYGVEHEYNDFVRNHWDDQALLLGLTVGVTAYWIGVNRLIYRYWDPKIARWILIGTNLIYAGIVTNNVIVSVKLRI